MRTYFDTDSLKVGMLVEYDSSAGLNSRGVTDYLTKVTKTYVEGYSIIGDERGDIKKITNPKTVTKKKEESVRKEQTNTYSKTEFIRELKLSIGSPYDPLMIKLNRHMFYEDRDLGGIFCGAGVKIDNTLFDEGIGFQHPRSYNTIKRITLKIKHARVEFI